MEEAKIVMCQECNVKRAEKIKLFNDEDDLNIQILEVKKDVKVCVDCFLILYMRNIHYVRRKK